MFNEAPFQENAWAGISIDCEGDRSGSQIPDFFKKSGILYSNPKSFMRLF